MKDTLQILFGLLGGLAIFIFGMNMMSECLCCKNGKVKKYRADSFCVWPVIFRDRDDGKRDEAFGWQSVFFRPDRESR